KWLLAVLGAALLAGAIFAARTVDRLALAYLTGQRRVAGQDFSGDNLPLDGPVPGYAFLGITRPSEEPPGMVIARPWEMALEIGLRPGDVITSVEGSTFRSSNELMQFLVRNHGAGDVVSLTVVRDAEPPRELSLKLRAFVRHPGDLGLPYEEIEIESRSGYHLRGWLVPPPERSDGRLGVFVHGANASRFQALENGAKHWYRRGYGLISMDLSGRGNSGGEYITYTVNERLDVRSILEWARSRERIDPKKVVLFGTSNGAAASIYAAAGDEELPALVVDAPYGDLWDAAGHMLRSRGTHPALRYPLFVAVRLRAGIDLWNVRPLDVVTEVLAPVLFVHGDADRQVPVTHSQQMHEARNRAGLPSELWVLPGGEHGFDNYPPEGIFWGRVIDFYDRALGGPPGEWDLTSGS
ncbi:MAG TPA: CocE/NonD family hydrolase, partial [Vicinamibacteria bacterium]|nr:CocE/NonD family hydrolase [Vicinamibacteria bacterium]